MSIELFASATVATTNSLDTKIKPQNSLTKKSSTDFLSGANFIRNKYLADYIGYIFITQYPEVIQVVEVWIPQQQIPVKLQVATCSNPTRLTAAVCYAIPDLLICKMPLFYTHRPTDKSSTSPCNFVSSKCTLPQTASALCISLTRGKPINLRYTQ